MEEGLIDRIYECAFVPEYWPKVLDSLSEIATARGGVLFAANTNILNYTASDVMAEGVKTYVESNFFAESPFATPSTALHGGFWREIDFNTVEEIEASPFYQKVLHPVGLGWCAGTVVLAPTGDRLIMLLERDRERGPVEDEAIKQLDPLRPHLARAMLTSARLQLERASAAVNALEMLGLPALVFNEHGKVSAANELIEGQTGLIHWRAHNQIALVDRNANVQFQHALATLGGEGPSPIRSFAIRSEFDVPAMVAHVIPVRRSARDIFAQCAGVLMLTPLTQSEAPSVELVQSLFDLTPAEARVARSLTAGHSVEQIAADGAVSLNTIRTQVRGVLEKTGCTRQAEVVSLLSGIAMPAQLSV